MNVPLTESTRDFALVGEIISTRNVAVTICFELIKR
jgi:hypothetical protein